MTINWCTKQEGNSPISKPSCNRAHNTKSLHNCEVTKCARLQEGLCKVWARLLATLHTKQLNTCRSVDMQCASKPYCSLAQNAKTMHNCVCARVQARVLALLNMTPNTQLWIWKGSCKPYYGALHTRHTRTLHLCQHARCKQAFLKPYTQHKILVQLWKCKVSKPSCSLAHDAKTIPNCASSSKVQVRLLAPLQTAQNPCTIVNAQRCKQICKPCYNLAHDTRTMYWSMWYARCLSKPFCDLAYKTRTLTNCECANVQASILVTQEPRCTIVNVPGASKPSGWSLAHDRKALHNCECTRLQEELTHQW